LTYGGRSWSEAGRSGTLDFGKTITDLRSSDGQLVIHSRRIGIRQRDQVDD
jgi:hypothetical protein